MAALGVTVGASCANVHFVAPDRRQRLQIHAARRGATLVDTPAHETVLSRDVLVPGLAVLALRADEQDVLVVLGEADMATAQLLYDQVLQALPVPPRPVVVELGALTFCDLSGLDALRDVARAAETAGVALAFRGQSRQLQWLQRNIPASCCRRSRQAPALTASASTAGASC